MRFKADDLLAPTKSRIADAHACFYYFSSFICHYYSKTGANIPSLAVFDNYLGVIRNVVVQPLSIAHSQPDTAMRSRFDA